MAKKDSGGTMLMGMWWCLFRRIMVIDLLGVHRLVALAFIPNPDNLSEVNHKDYDRTNPSVDNLEWISHVDNIRYSLHRRRKYYGSANPNFGNRKLSKIYKNDKKLSKEKQGRPGLQNGRCRRIQLFYDGEFVKEFDYVKLCCEYFIQNHISNITTIEGMRSQIDTCIRENRPYKGHYTFKKL